MTNLWNVWKDAQRRETVVIFHNADKTPKPGDDVEIGERKFCIRKILLTEPNPVEGLKTYALVVEFADMGKAPGIVGTL